MVLKKKVKSEMALTDLEIPQVKEEVSLSEEDARIEPEAPAAAVSRARFSKEESDMFREVVMVLNNLLKVSNNVPMRLGIKRYISVLGPMGQEATKE